jgi:hypothetical protein
VVAVRLLLQVVAVDLPLVVILLAQVQQIIQEALAAQQKAAAEVVVARMGQAVMAAREIYQGHIMPVVVAVVVVMGPMPPTHLRALQPLAVMAVHLQHKAAARLAAWQEQIHLRRVMDQQRLILLAQAVAAHM